MADLFTPLQVAGRRLANRIVMAPAPSGLAGRDGFCHAALVSYYERRARAGVGFIITEPLLICDPGEAAAHLGIWHDGFLPGLRRLSAAAHAFGSRIAFLLEAPAVGIPAASLVELYLQAAWRALAAGADGVFLSIADDGALAQLVSPRHPLSNGGAAGDRIQPVLAIIEQIRQRFGRRLWVGLRMPAAELIPGGLSQQDARLIARRAVAAGAQLLDVTVTRYTPDVARFPGWTIPLITGIRRIASEAVVIGSGQLSDPLLADAVIQDGSIDLVMLCTALRVMPEWPLMARRILFPVSVE
ncbi:NADH:flavin oxidoreductase [Chloroflexus islandicus]|uniref:NADH:flavin oxidoreductase n=1 Tax=Chloroflexus islandicus TaxID=1707952 RepID=A0A178MJG8_9CHLR|nr:NADH:flavin oxidoreductase [Chloroflexus islandicus]OAN48287.1 NADH:flavin oxidoreductase [Chloroflexus islandicus]